MEDELDESIEDEENKLSVLFIVYIESRMKKTSLFVSFLLNTSRMQRAMSEVTEQSSRDRRFLWTLTVFTSKANASMTIR